MKNITENINNLKTFWKTAGTTCGVYCDKKTYSYCAISNSQWPNRFLVNTAADAHIIDEVLNDFYHHEVPMSLSYWADFGDPTFKLFEREELRLKSEQIGMSLEIPKKKFATNNRLELRRITTTEQAQLWEELYPQFFGYVISAHTIEGTMDQIEYFLIYHNQVEVGTVITFDTNTVVGIHGMGILPAYRKQGFAQEVLLILLNRAVEQEKTLATLQASAMGKAIYKNIGFSEDFLVRNYRVTL